MRSPIFSSLSVDLDNLWCYLRTHGRPEWETAPTMLPKAVERLGGILAALDLPATFFVIGRDAADGSNAGAMRSLVAAGHEIGSHSYGHETWFAELTAEEIDVELGRAEQAISEATGVVPRGFRAPGFSVSATVVDRLVARGYDYDASTLPTIAGPAIRAVQRRTTTRDGGPGRRPSFGSLGEALRPLRPYRWSTASGNLVELPVSTLPWCRLPAHSSYVLAMAARSPRLAQAYWDAALRSWRLAGLQPSVLLHALDVMGADDVPGLAFFPGMRLGGRERCRLVTELLRRLRQRFEVVRLADHAARASRAEMAEAVPGQPGLRSARRP